MPAYTVDVKLLDPPTGSVLVPGPFVVNVTGIVLQGPGGEGGGAVSSVFGRTGAVTAHATDYDEFYDTLGDADAAQAAATATSAADATSKANAAQTAAANYTDTAISGEVTRADAAYDTAGAAASAQTAAITAAAADASTKANAAQAAATAAADTYTDGQVAAEVARADAAYDTASARDAAIAAQHTTDVGLFDALGAAAAAQAAAIAASQPLDSDLTAIALLSTTAFGRSVLTQADAAALRTLAGLGTAATHATGDFDTAGAAAAAQAASQPLDADLTAIAALATTSFGRSFLALADAAAGRTLLGLGTAATAATTDFATAAQGAKADSAVQPGDLGGAALLDVGTTTGTVAAGDDSRFGSSAVTLTTVAAAGTSQTVTAATHGSKAYKLVGSASSCAITPTGGTAAEECSLTLYLDQDASGARAWTFASSVDWGTTGAPAFSTAAGKRDVVVLTTIDGGGSWFGGLVAVGITVPTVPAQVTGLGVTAGNAQNVLAWTAPAANGSTITAYKVYRSTSSGTETLLTTLGNVTTYTDTGLTNGTTYYYKISAVNGVGEGAQSSEQSGTPSNVVTLAADTFTGSDSTTSLIGRSTPTGSKTWTHTAASTTNWGISSNKAYKSTSGTSGLTSVYVDTGQADVTVQCDYTTGAAANDTGLLLRYVDDSNWMNVIVDPGGVYIQKKIAGSQTNAANWAHSMTGATTYTLKVVLSGSSVSVYVDGTLRISATVADAAILTATKHGMFGLAAAVDMRWDNFTVTQP